MPENKLSYIVEMVQKGNWDFMFEVGLEYWEINLFLCYISNQNKQMNSFCNPKPKTKTFFRYNFFCEIEPVLLNLVHNRFIPQNLVHIHFQRYLHRWFVYISPCNVWWGSCGAISPIDTKGCTERYNQTIHRENRSPLNHCIQCFLDGSVGCYFWKLPLTW